MRKRCFFAVMLLTVISVLSACGQKAGNDGTVESPAAHTGTEAAKRRGGEKGEELISRMTLEEKLWQMFFVTPEDITGVDVVIQAGDATERALEECPVGGIIYFGQNIKSKEQLSEMISNTQSYSKIPLLISVDEEGGRVSRLSDAGITEKKPPMRDIGDMGEDGVAEAYNIGLSLGEELSEIGFNMDFAPVADIITVEENKDIGDRSFGNDPYLAARMVAAEVKGLREKNVSAVLKHFPGNGSTAANTHEGIGICQRTPEEMRECEFIPFKAGIDAGADAVMVAHMAAVKLTGGETPSTLSDVIIQDYLRGELGFQGLVITDAMNMGAVTDMFSPEEAAVKAVQAGADMILMSPDVRSAHGALLGAVRTGEISEERIDESVRRILKVKHML